MIISVALLGLTTGCNLELIPGEKKGPELAFTTESALNDAEVAGIFMTQPFYYRNVKATYANGKLLTDSKLNWPVDAPADSAITFRAYVPYSEAYNAAGVVAFSIQPEQNTDEGFLASDLRTAKAEASPSSGAIKFDFSHRMAKLTVYLQSENEIEEVTLSGIAPSAYLNFESELFRPGGDKLEVKGHLTAKNADGVCAYEFIIVPQSTELLLTAVAGGLKNTATTTGDITFEGGKQYTHDRLILVDGVRKSAVPFNFREEEWPASKAAEPSFSYEEPLPNGVDLSDATDCGLYSYNTGMVEEILLATAPGFQNGVSTSTKAMGYRIMNPAAGQLFFLSITGTTLSEGSSYSGTITTYGLDGIPTSLSTKFTVVKKANKTAWLADETNNLAYIITTSK